MTTTPPDPTKPAPAFNVRVWFLSAGLAAILLVNAGLAYTLSNYVVQRMTQREGQLSQEFLSSTIKAEGTADTLFSGEGHEGALQSFAAHVQNLTGLLRANIYSPDLVIRFSTQPDLIGTVPEDIEELIPALTGQITTTLKNEVGDSIAARSTPLFRTDQRVIESYLPIVRPDGSVIAVVEFYRDAASLKSVISEITLIVWVAAGIGGLMVFGALYAAMTRGANIIVAQTKELQSMAILASLGQMAQAVAHSIRNPLASIRSSVELMQIQHPGISPDETADVISEVERINLHVQDLLDFSRSDSGTAQTVAIGPLLAHHLELAQPRFARFGIAVSSTGLNTPLRAGIEPRLFLQVVECVVTNAVEAMTEGGELTVTLTPVAGNRLELTFADTGPGIPPEYVARLPEPFFTTKAQGLGLGLSISKRIVERFGGTVRLGVVQPHGAKVTIILPIGGGRGRGS